MNFDQLMNRLQFIVVELEKNQISLEDAIILFEEGLALVKEGEAKIADFDKQLQELITNDK
jgi:exodeoxyribonuclease VII small subunit